MKLKYSFSKIKECEQIHGISLYLLSKMGLSVHSEEARDIYKKNGARVVNDKVYLDTKIVERCLANIPKTFNLFSPKNTISIGSKKTCTAPGYGAIYVNDDKKVKLASRKDFINFTKLNQVNAKLSMSCPYVVEPFDVPNKYRDIYKFVMTLKYSNKPTFSVNTHKIITQNCIDFAKNFYDNHSDYLLVGNTNLSSPLIMSETTADVIINHCNENQPLMISCGSGLSGYTAPPGMSSNLALNNASVLGGMVLAQMIQPGIPVIYGFPLFCINPKNASISLGNPVTSLFTMAAAEMGKYYKIPVRAGGNFTDSKVLDYQNGSESFMNLFTTLFSQNDMIIHMFGMENSLNTINYNKYILDEILYEKAEKLLEGFKIGDSSSVIKEIEATNKDGFYMSFSNLNQIKALYKPYPYQDADTIENTIECTGSEIKRRLADYKLPLKLTVSQQNLIKQYLPSAYHD